MKRKDCPIQEYGLVDMAAAKRQRLQTADGAADPAAGADKCPLPLSLVEDYEVRPKAMMLAVVPPVSDFRHLRVWGCAPCIRTWWDSC